MHEDADEFFLVLDGRFDVAVREADGTERTVVLHQGDTFFVPRGTEHKPSSPGGSILMFEPSRTSTTGDRHEAAMGRGRSLHELTNAAEHLNTVAAGEPSTFRFQP